LPYSNTQLYYTPRSHEALGGKYITHVPFGAGFLSGYHFKPNPRAFLPQGRVAPMSGCATLVPIDLMFPQAYYAFTAMQASWIDWAYMTVRIDTKQPSGRKFSRPSERARGTFAASLR
jgi:hypothetical protein